jgi:type II secretory pathway pseudopilin PulG
MKKIFAKKICSGAGMTLAELLVAVAILIIAIAGILTSYLRCLELNEVARNFSLSVKAATSRMEAIHSTPFAQIKTTFDKVTFAVPDVEGIGVTYVDDSTADLLLITACVSWRQRSGRVYGEDKNLNGQINAGEDLNGNGMLDGPVKLQSRFFTR